MAPHELASLHEALQLVWLPCGRPWDQLKDASQQVLGPEVKPTKKTFRQKLGPEARPLKNNFQPHHRLNVPRPEDLEARAHESVADGSPVVTMMLRNIPHIYTQQALLRVINSAGFEGTYDFFYLPMDIRNQSNVGYAFINFLSSEDASLFRDVFHGRPFGTRSSRKVGIVCAAHLQGLERNLKHLQHRAVTQAQQGEYRPVVLHGKRPVSLETALRLDKLRKSLGLQGAAPEKPGACRRPRSRVQAARQRSESRSRPNGGPSDDPAASPNDPAASPMCILGACEAAAEKQALCARRQFHGSAAHRTRQRSAVRYWLTSGNPEPGASGSIAKSPRRVEMCNEGLMVVAPPPGLGGPTVCTSTPPQAPFGAPPVFGARPRPDSEVPQSLVLPQEIKEEPKVDAADKEPRYISIDAAEAEQCFGAET